MIRIGIFFISVLCLATVLNVNAKSIIEINPIKVTIKKRQAPQNYYPQQYAPQQIQQPLANPQDSAKPQLARQVDDDAKPMSPNFKELYLVQYPTLPNQINYMNQEFATTPQTNQNQNWWNFEPQLGYPINSPYHIPYQQNAEGPQPVYQENKPPALQFFTYTTTQRPHITHTPTIGHVYMDPNNNPQNLNNQNNQWSNPNQQWPINQNQNQNSDQQWPLNQNQNYPWNGQYGNNQHQQDYYAGLHQQFYRMTTTTDMPNLTVKHIPDTYSKSFNPYEGQTARSRPVTPQALWFSRYADLTAPIAAVPFNNYKNIKK